MSNRIQFISASAGSGKTATPGNDQVIPLNQLSTKPETIKLNPINDTTRANFCIVASSSFGRLEVSEEVILSDIFANILQLD